MSHEDRRLDRFCEPKADVDTFNMCHREGWLRTWNDSDYSTVEITPLGRTALDAQ